MLSRSFTCALRKATQCLQVIDDFLVRSVGQDPHRSPSCLAPPKIQDMARIEYSSRNLNCHSRLGLSIPIDINDCDGVRPRTAPSQAMIQSTALILLTGVSVDVPGSFLISSTRYH